MEISIQRKAMPEKADQTLKKNHKGMKGKKNNSNGRPGNKLRRPKNHSAIWQHLIEVLRFSQSKKERTSERNSLDRSTVEEMI